MHAPRFGRRARRRARLRRLAVSAWVASLAASVVGLPTGIELLGRLEPAEPASGGVVTSASTAALLRFRREAFTARPAERPERRREPAPASEGASGAPAPSVAGSGAPESVIDVIHAAAAEFGLDGGYLVSVAECESELDPSAVSAAGYHGLFQFDTQTWAAYGYGSIYDPGAQARTAARLLASGHSSRWPNCA